MMQVRLAVDSKNFRAGEVVNWYDTIGGSLAQIGKDGVFDYVELSTITYQPKRIWNKI